MDKINQILVKYCRYTKTRITKSLEFELYHVLAQCNNKLELIYFIQYWYFTIFPTVFLQYLYQER